MVNSISPKHLQLLAKTVQELSLAKTTEAVMLIVRQVARQLTGADGATFVLRDRINDSEYCYYADEDAIGPLWKGKRFPINTCISGWAMLNKQSVVIEDIYDDERIPMEAYEVTFVKSMVMVPIRMIDPIGAIGNYWANKYNPTEDEISLLQSLADITAVTLENIKIYAELEQKVKDRTAELHEKNSEILSSISYAKRIQDAILTPVTHIKQYLKNCFVLYKPKDIVAGDFYWFETKGDMVFIAAADCTGHGVPGALVSVVCSNALNRSVNEFGITDTGKILDKTRELIIETFSKSNDYIRDGMDISLCSIDLKTQNICWSGANNNLWYIQNDELFEIKSHKQTVGQIQSKEPFPTHYLPLKKGDSLYLITDGFADQFGGIKGKKYKRAQLKRLIREIYELPMDEQSITLNNTFENWKGNNDQVDDVTVIGIRI